MSSKRFSRFFRPFVLLYAGLCINFSAIAQKQIEDYVRKNVVPIANISPDSDQFSDLTPIGNAIGNAKVVMLGEQDHGDAPTFLAKTRLIKYLHEAKGFNVLAFEEDFFSLNEDWHAVENGDMDIKDFIASNKGSVWGRCDACANLFNVYIPATQTTKYPLKITGFDDIMSTLYLLPRLDSVIHELGLPISKREDYEKIIFPLLNAWYRYTKDGLNSKLVNKYLTDIKEQMLGKLKPGDFWVRVVENFIQLNYQFYNSGKDYWLHKMNARDTMMAVNLTWLNKIKYPKEKIIVWAHNYHVSKYAGHYTDAFLNVERTMGTIFTKDSAVLRQTYVLGFTSYQGTAGRVNTKIYKIRKLKANSLENWIDNSYSYAYVDFKLFQAIHGNETIPFYMAGSTKGNRYHDSQLAEWTKIYDGIFFIRDMYPCKKTE